MKMQPRGTRHHNRTINRRTTARRMGLTPILLAAGMACAQPIALSWDTVDLITYSINEDTGVLHVRWDHSGYRPELRYYEWHLDDLEGARTACPDATNDQHCRAHSRFPGHALTPTGVMAIRCKQFHLPDL